MSGSSPLTRQSSMYSVHRSFLLTPWRSSSLRMYSKSGIRFVEAICFANGKNFSASTSSVSFASNGHDIDNSLARFSTRLTRFIRNTAAVSDALLAETQTGKSENLTILGHDCGLLKMYLHHWCMDTF